jgi:hypothetical protein
VNRQFISTGADPEKQYFEDRFAAMLIETGARGARLGGDRVGGLSQHPLFSSFNQLRECLESGGRPRPREVRGREQVIGQLLRSMETGKTENPQPEPSGSYTKLALLMDGVESRYVTTAHVAGCPSQEGMCRKSLGLSIETRRNNRAGINRVTAPVND